MNASRPRMVITRKHLLVRGLTNRCPNCGGGRLFEGWFRLRRCCPDCGMTLEQGEGFFLGSMSINYGVTVMGFLLPVLILTGLGWIPGNVAIGLGLIGALLFPALFYRSSRSWWLMLYFMALPHELPINGGKGRGEDL